LSNRIIASRLGPAQPWASTWNDAGAWLNFSQSWQVNFSRTRWITFHCRGDHLQRLGDVLAQLGRKPRAAAAKVTGRSRLDHPLARQMPRGRLARRTTAGPDRRKSGSLKTLRCREADSPSLSRSAFEGRETWAFRAAVGGWVGAWIARDAQGASRSHRINRRQYLCRAIFQYRSAAEVISENAAPVPTKLGLLGA